MNWEQKIREFWRKRTLLNHLLLPVSWLYHLAHLLNFHVLHKPKRVKPMVICIGNAVVGGAGKTPFALSLAGKLIKMKIKIAFITRGYGSSASRGKIATLVELPLHTALDVGDESILLARIAPTYVAKNRYTSALAAEAAGAKVIIMDDGLQNNDLHKDYSFLLLDNDYGLGNGYTLPAGPLREPYKSAKAKADTIVSITQANKPSKLGHIIATITPTKKPEPGQRYFAFCGIASPTKFFTTLELAGFNVASSRIFNDHHAYTESDIKSLIEDAGSLKLITTEKDSVKIPPAYANQIEVLPIELQFDIPDELLAKLKKHFT